MITEKSFNCGDRFIEIKFEYYDSMSQYHMQTGFLSPPDLKNGNCIRKHQEPNEGTCPYIKK
jgi:hypothetical protein